MKVYLVVIFLLLVQSASYAQESKIILAEDIELVKLSDKVYLHISYFETKSFGKVGANGLMVVDNGKALLLDTPWDNEQTKILATWLTDSLSVAITDFMPNHWHEDCMGGLEYLHSMGTRSYANQMTINLAKDKNLPVPEVGFTDSLSLKLNSINIHCYYLGGGHATDNIVVWIPSENILFAGCMSKDMEATTLGNLADAALEEWPDTIDKVLAKFPPTTIVVPGHGLPGGKELLTHTKELLLGYTGL